MDPRAACFACLERQPSALLEAALWIAAEHRPQRASAAAIAESLQAFAEIRHRLGVALDERATPSEQAQNLVRSLSDQGFAEDDQWPLQPASALLDEVLQRRCGQPLSLAIIALEAARQLGVDLRGVNFPGRFLLKARGSDHLLDPATGRRLYPKDCQELLLRQFGGKRRLDAAMLREIDDRGMLQRLSRNLRSLHREDDNAFAALKDAQRVVELGEAVMSDHLPRADLYRQLECREAERFDLQHALLLCGDEVQEQLIRTRLRQLGATTPQVLH